MEKNNSIKYMYLWVILFLITLPGLAQQKLITGMVTDGSNRPIPDASVTIREQPGVLVFTGNDGSFSIMAESGQILEVKTSDNHYKSQILGGQQVNLIITPGDELVPVGNRMQLRKEELTSAIGFASNADISKSSVWNPANALYGKIPGLTVLENGGPVWSNDPDMFIRGVETFGIGSFKNTNILTIVDGFERPISSLSMAEIENITVLKDAAALAMYGIRGANGVLLVTTKKGSSSKLSIDINYEKGITKAFRLPEFLDAYGYANAVDQARLNDELTPLYSQQELDRFSSGESPYLYPNMNWMRESLRDFGSSDKFNISFQQRTSAVRYFAMLNYDRESGLFGPVDLNSGYTTQSRGDRFNFRSNIDINITSTTNFTVNLAGSLGESQRPSTTNSEADIFASMYNTPSAAYPIKTPDHFWGGTSIYNNNPIAQISGIGYTVLGKRELLTDMILNQDLKKLLKGLTFEGGISFDKSFNYSDVRSKQFRYKLFSPVIDPVTKNVIDTTETIYGTNTTMNFTTALPAQWRRSTVFADLKYSKEWADNQVKAILLAQQEEFIRNGQNNTYRHQLVAGNVHYAKGGKYFADLSLAYNGTNVLPVGNRSGLFPAVSVAWKLSNEDFLKESSFFSDLKLRASWGIIGNDQVIQNINQNPYVYSSGYWFGANNTSLGGYREGRLASSPLTFETSSKTNAGIDGTLFKSLDITFDVFYDKRQNILVQTNGSTSSIIGVPTPYSSTGIASNKGFELGMNLHKEEGALQYNIGGQLSFAKNQIIEMQEQYRPEEYLKRTGQSISQAFGLEAIGFFANDAEISESPKQTFSVVRPGDIKYKDQNGDKFINSYDEVPIGSNTQIPEMYFSGFAGVEFRGIGMDVLFQGTANQTVYLNTSSVFWPLVTNTNISTFSDGAWTPGTASTATLPRLTMSDNANNYRTNSIWYQDGSYLKLRSVEVYYDLPKSIISKMKVGNARLYVRGMNLLSVDNIKVLDPEAIGISYPTTSSYNIGIRIGL